MSDNIQADNHKNESEESNESKPTQESTTTDTESHKNEISSDGGKDKDEGQEKMDVVEDTIHTEPEESHTEVAADQALVEKEDQSGGDQSNIVEDVNMDDKQGDSQDEVNDSTEEGSAKGTQDITGEDVDMNKPHEEEPSPTNLVEDTNTEEGGDDISEDVNMTEDKGTSETEAAQSSDKQVDSIGSDENSIIKDTEAIKDSNASEETTAQAVESAEVDCTDNNDSQKSRETQEVVDVDRSDEINENDNTILNNSQSNDDNVDANAEDSTAKLSESKDDNGGDDQSSNKDVQLTNEEDTSKNSKTLDNSNLSDEHSIFVQVNNEKDDNEKSGSGIEQATNEIDPIGSSEWSQNIEPTENSFVSDLDEADECIIPDASKDDSSIIPSSQESEAALASTPLSNSTSESDSMRLSEKYLVSVANIEEESRCMICDERKVCKYNCVKDSDKSTLCSEECLTKLKERHAENVIVRKLRVKNFSTDLQGDTNAVASSIVVTGNIHCKNCGLLISNVNNSLSWEAFDFCDEVCLTKHQKMIGSYCANCRIDVKENFLGKYCVRFGYNVRQFCSSTCLEQYKKNSKVCSFCQDDISTNPGGFLTSIADKGMAKDFCSAHCMHKYSEISKHLKGPRCAAECGVCHKINTVEIEFEYKSKKNVFCSQPCFVAFKYVNEVTPTKCDMCCKYFVPQPLADNYLIRYDGVLRKFCEKTCQNIYITTNRKIVSCCWCKVKKYNFDMIQKYTPDNAVIIICSLTCLNFFNASVNATKLKKKRCDYCHKICKGQYHITLADDSLKHFCSYPCVQEYQNKYITAPARFTEQPVAMPSTTTNTRITRKTAVAQRKQIIPDVPGPLPIITSVRSLAPTASQNITTRALRSKSSGSTIATITTLQETTAPAVRRIVLVRPPDLPQQRNVSTSVKPITADVEAEIKPIMVDKAVQTEDIKDSLVLLPVPVPIYLPAPMRSFNLTHPLPLPFPLPIPIPMFLAVTKQTAGVVLKDLKKAPIQTDPYEADLLMMAELVAGENEKKEQPESEAEAESDGADHAAEPAFSPEQPDPNNSFGDDMLQMALKMASDFDEPAVDLEGALTANTITATPGTTSNEPVEEVAPIQPPPVERSTFRGRRRGRPPRHGGRGRGRGRPPTQPEVVLPVEQEPPPPPEPVEKPDANMCLKYTFGVNAWKQWVTTKNAELEKSSRRPKLFKSDILQLTSDELNYSLCLFVKEVRKPNGAEYAPDTIYYLCLGVQQYLFENGRIDNIFCDSYYESFTDCLDEVCKKFSTLYNDSQYIVTRVEEEHLWESKQLGAHSPHVLLSTLMFFNTKHFNLTNVDEHMQLSFSHIMKHWKRVPNQPGQPKNATSRNILLRFYPPQSAVEGNNRKKKVYEQQENEENPLRCPVKLYEFYLSKCPESVKTRNDVFYLLPERSCVPDSPVWYSTMALGKEALEKMLHRVKMVKEINVALLAS